ncbi:MAG: ABC transporter permease [Alphaproteobacteria bacterium]|nr:ABC transporter permease [Alphaproteobacteria bacterium]
MTFLDAILSAAGALRQHKLRSVLTALGIIVGTSATITMMAVGAGAREKVAAQIRSLGSDLLIVISGNSNQGGVRLGAGAVPSLSDEDATAIGHEIPEVQVTSSLVNGRIQVVADAANWATNVLLVDVGYLDVRDWNVEAGRPFDAGDIARNSQVVLVGQTVARQLFPDQDPIGRELRIRNVPFRVIGLLAKKGQSPVGQDQDDAVLVPLEAGRRVLGHNPVRQRAVAAILVKVRAGLDMKQAEQEVQSLLRQRHQLQALQDDDFTIKNLSEVTSASAEGARTLSILLASVALVSLATGGIGILNIMLVSVSERTREIGIRMALGAKRKDILRQFLLEAVGLSVLGGIAGAIVGFAAAAIVSYVAGWSLIIETWSVIMALASSILVGVFFGSYPALHASLLDPIEAIRST